jgi:hypothetical protein
VTAPEDPEETDEDRAYLSLFDAVEDLAVLLSTDGADPNAVDAAIQRIEDCRKAWRATLPKAQS